MFDPIEYAEDLKQLVAHGTFVLVAGQVRKAVKTEYGSREPVDLRVATIVAGELRLFGGFSAGVRAQLRNIADGDLPAIVRLVEHDTGQASPTLAIELVDKLELPRAAGPERDQLIAAAAAMQAHPIDPKPADPGSGPGALPPVPPVSDPQPPVQTAAA